MQLSCLGFIFDHYKKRVVLIEKNIPECPEWHKGTLNGIGGKIEKNETPHEAMVREAREETQIETELPDWIKIGEMEVVSRNVKIFVFTTIVHRNLFNFPIITKEGKVDSYVLSCLPENCFESLKWLLPLCLNVVNNIEMGNQHLFRFIGEMMRVNYSWSKKQWGL